MEPKVQLAIDLVHRRDTLVQQRATLTADLDRQIDHIDAELASLTTGQPSDKEPSDAPANGNGSSYAAKVLNLLAASPGLDYGTMAARVYGADNRRNRNRLRAVLDFLGRQEKARRVGKGSWEAVTGK